MTPLSNSPLLRARMLLVALVLSISLTTSVSAQTLLSHYTLDGNATDTGSLAVNGSTSGAATFTNTGAGVGTFNEALRVGSGATDHFIAPTANNSAFATSALTIALWVNVDTAAANDRFVSNLTSSNGFDLYMGGYSPGAGTGGADLFSMTFVINGTSGGVSSSSATYLSDKWLFVAVTYNSSNALFYVGDETTGVALKTTIAYAGGSIVASTANLEIGGTPATTSDRTPPALFNDVRVYNGVLSLGQLEAVRASAIPEPSNYALGAGLLAFAFLAIRPRRGRS